MRVVLAEDSPLFREGLARILSARGLQVVAEAGDAEELLRKVAAHRPDVAVVDIRMPPTHTDEGLRAAERLFVEHRDVGVLVLSQFVEARYAMRLLEHRTQGVGYLLKDRVTDLDSLAAGIRAVAAGGSVIDPEVVGHLVQRRRDPDPLAELTDREREVLQLMAEGRSNRAISDGLFLSERTVEHHVSAIFSKLGLAESSTDHRRVLAALSYLREPNQQ